ncbi:NAD(P)-dependent oxidoreductase [Bremerella sp. T1]|uniref:NAD(P)-dependent oxidoreductase n=1 Tax=Bremerella sp. TYQ1 TaxID=3119568 RepID=UPI001CCC3C1E|nr:NAD(P)-binding oxidoreductase [Bremerella volcania]UBM35074.1 SDR family oxidoreductase [Bremerella volcania]
MAVLVLGATGATGGLLVAQLLDRGLDVRVIVRSRDRLCSGAEENAKLSVTEASLLDLSDAELTHEVQGCDAIASCLGHNLTLKGVFGHPRRLVTDAVRRIACSVERLTPERRVKFVLMNTAGNRNRDLNEEASLANRMVVGLIRYLVPPHADNEQAAEVLRCEIGKKSDWLDWVVVRPDSLTDETVTSSYEIAPSPTRDPIFNAGKTSRINVAHFMADLITDEAVWTAWRGQMPVIYNRS